MTYLNTPLKKLWYVGDTLSLELSKSYLIKFVFKMLITIKTKIYLKATNKDRKRCC